MATNDLRYMLCNVPLTDPTAPYHSLSYLVGHASAQGFERHTCLDLNIHALNYAFSPEFISHTLTRCSQLKLELEGKDWLSTFEQMLYRLCVIGGSLTSERVQDALAVFRDPDRFYNYRDYRGAAMTTRAWMRVLTIHGIPEVFDGFYLRLEYPINYSSVADLCDEEEISRITSPLMPGAVLSLERALAENDYRVIGFSCNYIGQLPFAIHLQKLARNLAPNARICIGGTEVSDIYKYLRSKDDIHRIFDCVDDVVLGEGETAFVNILKSVAGARQPVPSHPSGHSIRGPAFEDLNKLGSPRYDIWDFVAYWSPEPVILYSPTRGCYWNKCTFCDYGLNSDLPTSPARALSPERIATDLGVIKSVASVIYFAVDAMSPSLLRRLCQLLIESDTKISWGAELRLEKRFQQGELAAQLARSGCVAISFGYESASQRILDLIDKGIDIDQVPLLLEALNENGIGAQMMGFVGFPSESLDEARMTFDFLRNHETLWALAGIGDFVLTDGAIVAKSPAKFGIRLVETLGDDILRFRTWSDVSGKTHFPVNSRPPELREAAEEIRRFADDRPFVGGIDSAHSLLYFKKFGKRLIEDQEGSLTFFVERSRIPIANFDNFADADFCREEALRMKLGSSERLSFQLGKLLHEKGIAVDRGDATIEIFCDGRILVLDEKFEATGSAAYQEVKQMLLARQGLV